jgi:cytohesin
MLPRNDAESLELEAQCTNPSSNASRKAVAELKAQPPNLQAIYMLNFIDLDLAKLAKLALTANISADTRTSQSTPVLCVAASKGHTRTMKVLLDGGAHVNLADKNGFTPLHFAAQTGHVDAAEVLISAGCSVDSRSSEQATPLHVATQDGHLPMVQLLLARGANPNALTVYDESPVMLAALSKHAPCVAELLPVSDLSRTNRAGHSVFHLCAATGSVECFELLLPLMSDVDVGTVPGMNRNGEEVLVFNATPLHLACSFGQQAIAKALLRKGASRTARDNMHRTPLHEACQVGHLFLLALLVGRPGRYKLTPDEVNAADVTGCTPLHYAALNCHIQCCGVLIAAGARLDVRSADGKTPLKLAQHDHPANAELHAMLAGGGPAQAPGTLCDHCGEPEAETKLKSCIDCLVARYCSTACANAAWRSHKAECRRIKAARVERATPPTHPQP